MTIYFTSDLHLGHANIIKYSKRPFASVTEMDEGLIKNWNIKVKQQDTVYFLGDFAFAQQDRCKELLEQLNGNIYLCRGNHDKPLRSLYKYFVDVFDLRTISIEDPDAAIVLCHFPLLTWDKQRYNSIHLHGHCHGGLTLDKKVRRLDVGVDAWNYAPVSYDEIKQFLKDNMEGDENFDHHNIVSY